MPRPGVTAPQDQIGVDRGAFADLDFDSWFDRDWISDHPDREWSDEHWTDSWADLGDGASPLATGGVPGRRTVKITGHGAEGYASRNGTTPTNALRYTQLQRHERPGFRPDRVAMWAVFLGVVLLLAAVTSAHAAALVAHHALALR
jgi:hypothetical protein